MRRGGDQRADAEHREQGMAEATKSAAQTEGDPLAPPARNAHAEHHHVVGTGRGGDQHGGKQESGKLFETEHDGRLSGKAGNIAQGWRRDDGGSSTAFSTRLPA